MSRPALLSVPPVANTNASGAEGHTYLLSLSRTYPKLSWSSLSAFISPNIIAIVVAEMHESQVSV